MKYITNHIIRLIAVVAVVAVAGSWSPARAGSDETAAVLDHHLSSFGAGDIEALLSDYTDDSVLLTLSGPVRGLAELRAVFNVMIAEFTKPGARFEILRRSVEGDIAFIAWHAETADNIYEIGTDTFLIVDGKIAVQTFAAQLTPK